MKTFILRSGAVFMVLGSLAFVWKAVEFSAWNLLAVPVYVGFAVMFWRSATRVQRRRAQG